MAEPQTTPPLPKRPSKFSNLLNRLSPARPHLQAAINDFYIRLDKPHRKYKPGDSISGSIVLKTCRAMRITHLTLTLSGSVMLYPNGKPQNLKKEFLHKDKKGRTSNTKRQRGTPIYGQGGGKGVLLFENEQIVVGDGRLGAGGLEVGFVCEFPSKGLVSSLDFERGAIQYYLTANLTRPVTINPVTTCSTVIKLVENLDVSYFKPPKPITISIEPIKKRTRSIASSNESTHSTVPASPQLSPSLTGLRGPRTNGSGAGSGASLLSASTQWPVATITLQKAAALPGEMIPIKIAITHTKAIKSMSGVIVTLSRQGRCDTFPLTSSDSELNDSEPLTASSLSFSKTSLMTFRKDLAQTFAPIIVDPRTFTTTIKTSVRIPEDAFPSISDIPSGILSFVYFVEVIVDLGGKLGQRGNLLSSMSGVMGTTGGDEVKSMIYEDDKLRRDTNKGRDGWLLETDKVRREKGVIHCTFEIIVGTVDTSANKRSNPPSESRESNDSSRVYMITPSVGSDRDPDERIDQREREREHIVEEVQQQLQRQQNSEKRPMQDNSQQQQESHDAIPAPEYEYNYDSYDSAPYNSYPSHPTILPPSNIQNDSNLDDKSRLRLAEEQLLPSAPPLSHSHSYSSPGPSIPSSSYHYNNSIVEPSAPPLLLETDEAGPSTIPPPSTLQFSSPSSFSNQNNNNHSNTDAQSHDYNNDQVPTYVSQTDDKMELERQRLITAASAPPVAAQQQQQEYAQASAPMIPEELAADMNLDMDLMVPDIGTSSHYDRHTSMPLPRYER